MLKLNEEQSSLHYQALFMLRDGDRQQYLLSSIKQFRFWCCLYCRGNQRIKTTSADGTEGWEEGKQKTGSSLYSSMIFSSFCFVLFWKRAFTLTTAHMIPDKKALLLALRHP